MNSGRSFGASALALVWKRSSVLARVIYWISTLLTMPTLVQGVGGN